MRKLELLRREGRHYFEIRLGTHRHREAQPEPEVNFPRYG